MHKHRDDVAGVPFLFLTPTRRPISRPSSRASARLYPARPDTPNSAPSSPLSLVFRRPHTPLVSPLAGGQPSSSYMSIRSASDYSPSSSPILSHAHTVVTQQFTASLPASPLSSPRLLNAKASEFKPIPRPLSAASSHPGHMRDTPSPDMWAHSPFRATSNLAIAAPLLPEQSLLTRSLTPNSGLRSSIRPDEHDSDEEDPFDPFAQTQHVPTFNSFNGSDFDAQWSNSSHSSMSPEDPRPIDMHYQFQNSYASYDSLVSDDMPEDDPDEAEAQAALTDGMTPFDVLSSVFGSTLAPSELEEALAANAYDFDRSMAWLVDRALPPTPQTNPIRMQSVGGRVTVVSRDIGMRGGRGGFNPATSPGNPGARYTNGRPAQGGNRVCRYFVAGECLRADCRFRYGFLTFIMWP